ncbi:hypothetical protein [Bradyrhizobium sp. 6(2017)]|uniref:hypothetical protein n=1 Tax=Bradyrhizobium sp. 6(2017) TaxID=1197460 RepID=UPI0013E1C318|nr:hypothetical protein [Bradyrhizobium sp. 6(2017)]QIG95543.1 hypothetical protein G6P99_26175 [Bradyrhizobium sp. 6(2017)]
MWQEIDKQIWVIEQLFAETVDQTDDFTAAWPDRYSRRRRGRRWWHRRRGPRDNCGPFDAKEAAQRTQLSLIAECGLLMEVQVLEIVTELMWISRRPVRAAGEITMSFINRYGTEYDRPITNRWIGSILRNKLNLQTYKSHGVYGVPLNEKEKVELLCERYGVNASADYVMMHTDGDFGDVADTP